MGEKKRRSTGGNGNGNRGAAFTAGQRCESLIAEEPATAVASGVLLLLLLVVAAATGRAEEADGVVESAALHERAPVVEQARDQRRVLAAHRALERGRTPLEELIGRRQVGEGDAAVGEVEQELRKGKRLLSRRARPLVRREQPPQPALRRS